MREEDILPVEHEEPEGGHPLARVSEATGIEEIHTVFRDIGFKGQMCVTEEDDIAPLGSRGGDEPAGASLGAEAVPVGEE